MENRDDNMFTNRAWESNVGGNIQILANESLYRYELEQHKP